MRWPRLALALAVLTLLICGDISHAQVTQVAHSFCATDQACSWGALNTFSAGISLPSLPNGCLSTTSGLVNSQACGLPLTGGTLTGLLNGTIFTASTVITAPQFCIGNSCITAWPASSAPAGTNELQASNTGGTANVAIPHTTTGSVLIDAVPPSFQPNFFVAPTTNSTPFSTYGGLAANYANVFLSNLTNPYSYGWENFNGFDLEYNDLGGWAQNYYTPSYSKKDFLDGIYVGLNSYGQGQKAGFRLTQNCYGVGDCEAMLNGVNCYGGFVASGDESCLNQQTYSGMGNVEFTGVVTAGGTTGSTSLTISPSAGNGTQGDNRWLMDYSKAIPTTISTFTSSNTAPASMTVTTTGLGASTVNTTLTANVGPCTPCTVIPESMSGISNGQILFIADNETSEWVQVISAGGSSFTANLVKPHDATVDHSTITGGGAVGYCIEISTDNATPALMYTSNTLHYAWPIQSSASNTSLTVWMAAHGAYMLYTGNWANSSGRNGGVVYPCAEVYSVQQGGALSDTLTLSPNNVAWGTDTVMQPLYPSIQVGSSINQTAGYFPQPGGFGGNALAQWTMNGAPTNGQLGLYVLNDAPASLYNCPGCGGSGTRSPPGAAYFTAGLFNAGLWMATAPLSAVVQIQCPVGGCGFPGYNVLSLENNNGGNSDFLNYNPTSFSWLLSSGQGGPVKAYYEWNQSSFSVSNAQVTMGTPTDPWAGLFSSGLVNVANTTTATNGAAPALIASGYTVANASPVTLNTTGANLAVAVLTGLGTNATISDSAGNAWNYATLSYCQGSNAYAQIAYAYNLTTNAADVFTVSGGTGQYASIFVFSNMLGTSSVFDQFNCSTTVVDSPFGSGTITPAPGDVVVTGFYAGSNIPITGASINDSFASPLTDSSYLGAASYLLSASGTPIDPTWTVTGDHYLISGSMTSGTCTLSEEMIQASTAVSGNLFGRLPGFGSMALDNTISIGSADATHTWTGQTTGCVFTPTSLPSVLLNAVPVIASFKAEYPINSSPPIVLAGTYYDGASSQVDQWTMQDSLGAGTNPTSTLVVTHSGTSGPTTFDLSNIPTTKVNNLAFAGGGSAPAVGAPIVGQAACIKSAGPPVVIGYCSTVVGSGGACTCN